MFKNYLILTLCAALSFSQCTPVRAATEAVEVKSAPGILPLIKVTPHILLAYLYLVHTEPYLSKKFPTEGQAAAKKIFEIILLKELLNDVSDASKALYRAYIKPYLEIPGYLIS